jgi:2-oxoglutarate dehydrogenase E1 component
MLRLRAATSAITDFTTGTFRPVVPEEKLPSDAAVDRVLLCSGKVYWDLLAHREKIGDARTAIVRLEQLYPLDRTGVAQAIAQYGPAELFWVQEEPANQGAWTYIKVRLPKSLGRDVRRISRPASASPATGSAKVHAAEQQAIVEQAFAR